MSQVIPCLFDQIVRGGEHSDFFTRNVILLKIISRRGQQKTAESRHFKISRLNLGAHFAELRRQPSCYLTGRVYMDCIVSPAVENNFCRGSPTVRYRAVG